MYRTNKPWFQVGSLKVGTTTFITLAAILSLFVAAVDGGTGPVYRTLVFNGDLILRGQLWRIVTWPLTNIPSFFAAIEIVVFWWFGRDLEENIGKVPMAWMLGRIVLALSVVGVAISLLGVPGGLHGIGVIEFAVLLIWVGEWPQRRFFFGIPAWLFAVVIVGISLLQYLMVRSWFDLAAHFFALVFGALFARSAGLLTEYSRIPQIVFPSVPSRQEQQAKKKKETKRRDNERLDELLDKISADGLDSLSARERRELIRIRNRRN